MLDNKLLSILYYSIFIPLVVLPEFCNCTKVKDSYFGATPTSEYYLKSIVFPTTSTTANASVINKNKTIYDDIELTIKKISNTAEINRNTKNNILKSNTKLPIAQNETSKSVSNNTKKYNENEDKFVSNVLSNTKSHGLHDLIANHKKYLHMTFEEHKAQSMKSTKYNQPNKIDKLNIINLNHHHDDNQNYYSSNNETKKKMYTFQTRFNQKEPYYQEKLYYNNNDNKNPKEQPNTLYSKLKKKQKSQYLEKKHPHHQYNHYHHHHHHHYNLNKQNHHHQHNNNNNGPPRTQSEFFYAQNNGHINEDSLPPYIKKYNRRSKQLKNLLEGIIPITLPSVVISTSHSQHRKHHQHTHKQQKLKSIDYFGGNLKEEYNSKLHLRNHLKKNPKWIIENLFEEQRTNPNNPNRNDDNKNKNVSVDDSAIVLENPTKFDIDKMLKENKFPDDTEDYENYDFNKEKQNILSTVNRSDVNNDGLYKQKDSQNYNFKGNSAVEPKTFIYHRVDDPRSVGTGDIGKKQKLPFVAITDRRLEISTNLQHNNNQQRTNFELNNFPLP